MVLVLLFADLSAAQTPVGDTPTRALASDGQYIWWHEHLIDEPPRAPSPA